MPERLLLLLPTTSYRAEDFLAAASRLGVEISVASDRCHVLAEIWPPGVDFPPERSLALEFRDPAAAADEIVRVAQTTPFSAIVATGDETAVIAAIAARALGLAGNAPEATYAARNKRVMRERLTAAGVPCPRFEWVAADREIGNYAPSFEFPCVVKPLLLSASRGVIRANDRHELAAAMVRVRKLIGRPDVAPGSDPSRGEILVEEFVPGVEVALEGILSSGGLTTLALFDKPDPLDGPFFEETIYVTPSRLSSEAQRAIEEATARAAAAMGLTDGPVHAELRWSDRGANVIEVAARSIGGLCARTLRFGLGEHSLEELVIRRALGRSIEGLQRRSGASGVMMIPIPKGGVLQAVDGVEAARAVAGIEDVAITAKIGEKLVPLPEGASYLGFLFARGERPEMAEEALREAHRRLSFTIAQTLS